MIPLYTEIEFQSAKSKDKLPCECIFCSTTFYLTKYRIKLALNPNYSVKGNYCSHACRQRWKGQNSDTFIMTTCTQCNVELRKQRSASKRHTNTFCSHSCSTIYFNSHKTCGTKRSKLEGWLETQLTILYPQFEFHFNRKDAINSELDIYIPSIKLAFELNGILHYEPIYGPEKLDMIHNNDNRKFQACIEAGISLCIIDTSGQKYFKEATSIPYLEMIKNIIANHSISINQRTA